ILPAKPGDAFASNRFVREAEWVEANSLNRPPLLLEYSVTAPCAATAANTAAGAVYPDSAPAETPMPPRLVVTVSVREAPVITGRDLRVRVPAETSANEPEVAAACGGSSPTGTEVLLPGPPRTKA